MALPVYISDKAVMPQLTAAMEEFGLSLLKMGDLRDTSEGIEQDWRCCDNSGDLFFVSTSEASENNSLGLEPGTFCIIPGPRAQGRTRKETTEAFDCFRRALAAAGAQQLSR